MAFALTHAMCFRDSDNDDNIDYDESSHALKIFHSTAQNFCRVQDTFSGDTQVNFFFHEDISEK